MKNPIEIIGGGIAGQVLLRELTNRNIHCFLRERKSFPRPKVCGGILQFETWDYLRKTFNLESEKIVVQHISHYWKTRCLSRFKLNEPMISVSRMLLDDELNDVNISDSLSFKNELRNTVRIQASGNYVGKGEWLGFHGSAEYMSSDLEMRYANDIYAGISPSCAGDSHVALLIRRKSFKSLEQLQRKLREDLDIKINSKLQGTTGISYGYQNSKYAVGDSMMTTHPFLGLGMMHAIESSRLMAYCIDHRKITLYPKLHKKIFFRMNFVSSLIDFFYKANLARLIMFFLKHERLFLKIYRWVHKLPAGTGAYIGH